MFASLRRMSAALQELVDVARSLSEGGQDGAQLADLEGRLASLERTLEMRLAEMEALGLRADSSLKAARAAEERARGMEKRAQAARGDDEGDGELDAEALREAYEDAGIQLEDVARGEEAEVPPVRGSVAARLAGIQAATQVKFNRLARGR